MERGAQQVDRGGAGLGHGAQVGVQVGVHVFTSVGESGAKHRPNKQSSTDHMFTCFLVVPAVFQEDLKDSDSHSCVVRLRRQAHVGVGDEVGFISWRGALTYRGRLFGLWQ